MVWASAHTPPRNFHPCDERGEASVRACTTMAALHEDMVGSPSVAVPEVEIKHEIEHANSELFMNPMYVRRSSIRTTAVIQRGEEPAEHGAVLVQRQARMCMDAQCTAAQHTATATHARMHALASMAHTHFHAAL
jgi:hypothetical protein